MDKFSLDQVNVMLVDPDRSVRSTIRNLLIDSGFRKVAIDDGLAGVEMKLQAGMPDLLISDVKPVSGDFCDFVYRLRHHELGSNPFLPVIATTWAPTREDVKRVIQSGADDIVAKPLSAAQLFARITMLIKARKPFVVTSNYIGPDRRKPGSKERGEIHVDPVDVPNVLRTKAMAEHPVNLNAIQREIDQCIKTVNIQKLDRHAHQASWLVERIVPGLAFGEPDEATRQSLDRLLYVAEDFARRMVGTPYEYVGELCQALIDVTHRILKATDAPLAKDVDLLKPLTAAMQRSFDEEGDVTETVHQIFESVSSKTRHF